MKADKQFADMPLVSCIMPTANRRSFVPLAIQYFLSQDYPNKELVILDDGDESIADLIPEESQIRYFQEPKGCSLGEKRNHLCELARGNIIAHWDDDDWYSQNRLTYQLTELLSNNVDACGVSQLYFYNPELDKAWKYSFPKCTRRWLSGASLVYKKSFWQKHKFNNLNIGEDARFIWQASQEKILDLSDSSFIVASVHKRNSSPRRTNGTCWKSCSVESVDQLTGYAMSKIRAEIIGTAASVRAVSACKTTAKYKEHRRLAADRNRESITVSIPYYKCGSQIRKAVESILDQTHQDLALIVTNDGDPESPWEVLNDIDDPRLVLFDLYKNRGRYFVDEVVRRASLDRYFSIQDADDWSEPHRLERLLDQLKVEHADAVVSGFIKHPQNEAVPQEHRSAFLTRSLMLTPENLHRAHYTGLFDGVALASIGGCYGGVRVGYDTLIVNLLMMLGRVVGIDEPLFHYRIRPDSLTTSEDTGLESTYRRDVRRELQSVYYNIYRAYQAYLQGRLSNDGLARVTRTLVHRRVSFNEWTEVKAEAKRLGNILQERFSRGPYGLHNKVVQWPRCAPRAIKETWKTKITRLIKDPRIPWNDWAISQSMVWALAEHIEKTRPRRILELGTGISTAVLALYAAEYGASLCSIEHDEFWYAKTQALLDQFGLAKFVEIQHAPIRKYTFESGISCSGYDFIPRSIYDFVFIDGPPLCYGREAILFSLQKHIPESGQIWLHNGARSHELSCVKLWESLLPVMCRRADVDDKGLYIIKFTTSLGCRLFVGEAGSHVKEDRAILARADASITKTRMNVRNYHGPLVSCVMPTHDRPEFVQQAIRYFFRQDYTNRELIIVDDGVRSIQDTIPEDARIRYIRLPCSQSIGKKRNIGCEHAAGSVIVGWDDDDWYGSSRITQQVTPILSGNADATGIDNSPFLVMDNRQFWRCSMRVHKRMFFHGIVGGSLCFSRKFFEDGFRFPDTSLAEDAGLIKELLDAGKKIQAVENQGIFFYVRHNANSWQFDVGRFIHSNGWEVIEIPKFIPSTDYGFYGISEHEIEIYQKKPKVPVLLNKER